ncbi:hypothetical protein AB0D10_35405 [Kitasatospora sp. NPDC048545]|uniref:hypothetical protein n=1 Tax=Kitasatospora sp. NPDC048545 TaxID=3157208 RepID=UPI0033C0BFEE
MPDRAGHRRQPLTGPGRRGDRRPHPWRGTGTARRIHDALPAERAEDRVTLPVDPPAGDGKVQRLYEAWGYRAFTTRQPSPHSPRLTAVIRPTH